MKTVTGTVNDAKPISLAKAATLLSGFVSSETQASQDVSAYLRRAAVGFTELKSVHREIRSAANPNSEARHPKKKKKEKREEERKKKKKNRESDGEIGSEERKSKKKRKLKGEIDDA